MGCISCGYDRVPEEAHYCPQCGTALLEPPEPSSLITVVQDVGAVTGGRVTGVDVSQISGNALIQSIINTKERALSSAEEARQRQAFAEEELAIAVADYASRLEEKLDKETEEPYPGLYPYELTDSSYFYGRHNNVEGLLARMRSIARRHRLIVLHGESGTGKTSLLQAGLAPRLIGEGHLPLHVRLGNLAPGEELKRTLIRDLDHSAELRDQPLFTFLRLVALLVAQGEVA